MQCPMSGPGVPCGHQVTWWAPLGPDTRMCPAPACLRCHTRSPGPANQWSSDHRWHHQFSVSPDFRFIVLHSIGRIIPMMDRRFLEMPILFYWTSLSVLREFFWENQENILRVMNSSIYCIFLLTKYERFLSCPRQFSSVNLPEATVTLY